ncbi:unnamed protein product [Brachionus calyciflorus]|uniref:UBX domain-containing protein n=1 Tax=Brachionus calyciflorus TaxID=104777 RepID=A0A813QXD6_9BILA|nr:unnamed protein product [Brachionus calyciflorus]
MSSITVFCPNARRQQIKVQPSTKIIDILEEVCKKQGYASNEHELVYQKRSLDLTLTYRLSGIPNNAVVDLKKLESGPRQLNNVTISVQLEDGSRLAPQEFKPDSTNLFNVLEFYSTSSEILKNSLDESLAEQTETYPTITYLTEQIVGIKQLKSTCLVDLGLTNGRFILKFLNRKIEKGKYESLMKEFEAKQAKKLKLEEIYQKKKEAESEQTNKITENKVHVQEQLKFPEPIKQSEIISEPVKIETVSQASKKPRIEQMEIEQIIPHNEFANFKFPEETKGQNLNNFNELAEIERISKEACDRMSILYSLEETIEIESEITSEPNEEFYNVTVQDLRLMLSDLKKTQSEEAPLMTKQMRELEKDRKAMKYSKIVVRVVFKNRMVLQGLFRPKELLSELYKFVRESLSEENQVDDMDFYLFSTPPKTVLKEMKMTLFDANLCPAALVYFKNKNDTVPRFKSDIDLKSLIDAEEIAEVHVHRAIRDIKHEGLDWIEKDQKVVQNLLKTSTLTNRSESVSSDSYQSSRRDQASQDPVKNKLEKFLKGSKKF